MNKIFALCLLIGFTIGTNAQVTQLDALDNYSWNASQAPQLFSKKLQFSFVHPNQGFPNYGSVIAGGTYSASQDGGVFQLWFPYGPNHGGIAPKLRLGKYNNQGWSDWETFYTSANANLSTIDWRAKRLYISDKSYFSAPINIETNVDPVLTFNNTDNSWQYMQFKQSSVRKAWVGLDSSNNFNISKEGGGNIILRGGNVGIGTGTPESNLHIQGDNTPTVRIASVSTSTGARLLLTGKRDSGLYSSHSIATEGSSNINLGINADENMYLKTNGSTRLTVGTSGNIGIGTNNPSERLEVVTTHSRFKAVDYGTEITANTTAPWARSVRFRNENDNRSAAIGALQGEIYLNSNVNFETDPTGYISRQFTLKQNGNIGIGTTNPGDWKLAVNGKIRAKEIKVETGWSDFVFEKDYNLPTLQEVEQHIEEKGHLQDIPSAAEVAENGIFLGEMDSKLLQKIEELMLYTIQQQKDIKALKERNKKLEKELQALKKEIRN